MNNNKNSIIINKNKNTIIINGSINNYININISSLEKCHQKIWVKIVAKPKEMQGYKEGPSNFSTTNLCIVSLLLNCRLLTFGCVYFCSIGILTDLEVWRQVCPEIFHQMLKVCASAWLLLLFHKISISQFIFVISSITRKLSVKSVRSGDPRQFLLLFISNFFWAWTDDNQDYMLHF